MPPLSSLFTFVLTSVSLLGLGLSTGCVVVHEFDQPFIPECEDAEVKSRLHPVIGDYNVFYGSFHNHTAVSDGTGTPEQAYAYAKCEAGLDFFGLSDHDFSLSAGAWREEREIADQYNLDSGFVTFLGFEWTSSVYGHVTVVNADTFVVNGSEPTQTFEQLCAWLSAGNSFAILNHPRGMIADTMQFDGFAGPMCDKIAGLELWNKTEPFSVYYYNDGFYPDDNNKGYFDEALSRGWKIGAAGGFDDHWSTWGTAADFRLAVLAKNLTRQDVSDAMAARRFFSTLDKNLALSFTLDGSEMGSTILIGVKNLEIRASDGDGESFAEVVLFDGNHDVRRVWNPGIAAPDITDTLVTAAGDYYYVKVTQEDGDEAISSPIWVSP
jgi:hypothetical protein